MFLDCSVVGKQAETISKYVHKGDKLTVCGRLTQSAYTDKNGVRHTENSIFVEEFDLPEKPKSVEEQKEESVSVEDGISENPIVDNQIGVNEGKKFGIA